LINDIESYYRHYILKPPCLDINSNNTFAEKANRSNVKYYFMYRQNNLIPVLFSENSEKYLNTWEGCLHIFDEFILDYFIEIALKKNMPVLAEFFLGVIIKKKYNGNDFHLIEEYEKDITILKNKIKEENTQSLVSDDDEYVFEYDYDDDQPLEKANQSDYSSELAVKEYELRRIYDKSEWTKKIVPMFAYIFKNNIELFDSNIVKYYSRIYSLSPKIEFIFLLTLGFFKEAFDYIDKKENKEIFMYSKSEILNITIDSFLDFTDFATLQKESKTNLNTLFNILNIDINFYTVNSRKEHFKLSSLIFFKNNLSIVVDFFTFVVNNDCIFFNEEMSCHIEKNNSPFSYFEILKKRIPYDGSTKILYFDLMSLLGHLPYGDSYVTDMNSFYKTVKYLLPKKKLNDDCTDNFYLFFNKYLNPEIDLDKFVIANDFLFSFKDYVFGKKRKVFEPSHIPKEHLGIYRIIFLSRFGFDFLSKNVGETTLYNILHSYIYDIRQVTYINNLIAQDILPLTYNENEKNFMDMLKKN